MYFCNDKNVACVIMNRNYNKNMKKVIYLLLIMLFVSSCSVFKKSSKKKNKTKDNKQTEQVTDKKDNRRDNTVQVTPQAKKAPYKTCSFKCKTSFKGMPVSVTVRTSYDSLFWFSASSLGFEAMRVKADKDSIYMIDKINKENVQWTYSRASVYAGLPLSFDFIEDLFTDTVLVKSYNTAKFSGTVVKKLTRVEGISLPEQVNIDGTIKGQQQKITLTISNYKLNGKNDYPFEFQKGYKTVK